MKGLFFMHPTKGFFTLVKQTKMNTLKFYKVMRFAFLRRSLKVILEGDMGKRWKWQSLLLSCGSSEAPLTIDPRYLIEKTQR